MWFIVGFIVGALSLHAFSKGWLDTPIAWVFSTVKGWFK